VGEGGGSFSLKDDITPQATDKLDVFCGYKTRLRRLRETYRKLTRFAMTTFKKEGSERTYVV
jgi:hypothetical protein